MLLVLTAQDIAMFIINTEEECTLGTEGGNSQYVNFDLTTWMFWASVVHFSMIALVVISVWWTAFEICDCSVQIALVAFSAGIFLFAWTVIGFLLQKEIWNHGVNDQKCNKVLLAWLIIYLVKVALICSETVSAYFLSPF